MTRLREWRAPSARMLGTGGALVALAMAGCGGGERQDADEPSGTFDVSVVKASFPERQRLAEQTQMRITVRNDGQKAVPNVAVSLGQTGANGLVQALTERSSQANLADAERPIWIVDEAPRGGTTAYVGTWALGRLAAGQTKTFTWKLTAVIPGAHTVRYTVAAGLAGKAKAQTARGGIPGGSFAVDVSGRPAETRVDPDTGKVVRGDS